MKLLFGFSFLALVIASVALRLTYPDATSDRPVLYWSTDPNPAREEQVETFYRWQVANGHTAPDGGPACELRVDVSNAETTKKIIQGVSGVGADVMDIGGKDMRLLAGMGVIASVEEPAARLGFSLEETFEAVAPEIAAEGRQFMYPCNVTAWALVVNPAAFKAAGQPQPPRRWTVEEFERAGIAYVAAANGPGTRPADRKFFADTVSLPVLWRSFGASMLNETGTASGFATGGYQKALETWKRWVYVERILPTPDDAAAFATAQGYGGAKLQLFGRGNYAMLTGARWYLIQLRLFPGLSDLRAIELPHGGFPNTQVGVRGGAVYSGGRHPKLAHLFLAFLASDEYNALIVRDADALPPNPAALETEGFLRPPAFPDEWNFHGPFAEIVRETGIGGSYSPFVQDSEVRREQEQFQQLYEIGRLTVEEAVARTNGAVNRRIGATLERKPALRAEFERRRVIQAAVDRRRESGGVLPENWIFNAYFHAFYERSGRLGPAEPFPPGGEPLAAAAPGSS